MSDEMKSTPTSETQKTGQTPERTGEQPPLTTVLTDEQLSKLPDQQNQVLKPAANTAPLPGLATLPPDRQVVEKKSEPNRGKATILRVRKDKDGNDLDIVSAVTVVRNDRQVTVQIGFADRIVVDQDVAQQLLATGAFTQAKDDVAKVKDIK